jgi:hypothetical protein
MAQWRRQNANDNSERKIMTTAARIARKAADYIRKNGFSPNFIEEYTAYRNGNDSCGCFIHAVEAVIDSEPMDGKEFGGFYKTLTEVVGCGLGASDLRYYGWKQGADKDAAAALDIVADLLS